MKGDNFKVMQNGKKKGEIAILIWDFQEPTAIQINTNYAGLEKLKSQIDAFLNGCND